MRSLVPLVLIMSATVASAQVTQQFAAEAKSSATSAPTAEKPSVATNVRTALGFLNQGCVEFVLVRKAVVVGIPCRLINGGFDHSFRTAILIDQEMASVDKRYKSRWIKSPPIVAKVWGDGKHPYRERAKKGGLEVDFYYWTDSNIPDYIFALMKVDAQIEMDGGPTAPPYYLKMDVDYGHGVCNFFKQDLPHLLLRKSTNQRAIAKILQRRFGALDRAQATKTANR